MDVAGGGHILTFPLVTTTVRARCARRAWPRANRMAAVVVGTLFCALRLQTVSPPPSTATAGRTSRRARSTSSRSFPPDPGGCDDRKRLYRVVGPDLKLLASVEASCDV